MSQVQKPWLAWNHPSQHLVTFQIWLIRLSIRFQPVFPCNYFSNERASQRNLDTDSWLHMVFSWHRDTILLQLKNLPALWYRLSINHLQRFENRNMVLPRWMQPFQSNIRRKCSYCFLASPVFDSWNRGDHYFKTCDYSSGKQADFSKSSYDMNTIDHAWFLSSTHIYSTHFLLSTRLDLNGSSGHPKRMSRTSIGVKFLAHEIITMKEQMWFTSPRVFYFTLGARHHRWY